MKELRSVQNVAARFISDARKFGNINPVLKSLDWLPICKRIVLKLAMLVSKCLHGQALQYIANCAATEPTRLGRL